MGKNSKGKKKMIRKTKKKMIRKTRKIRKQRGGEEPTLNTLKQISRLRRLGYEERKNLLMKIFLGGILSGITKYFYLRKKNEIENCARSIDIFLDESSQKYSFRVLLTINDIENINYKPFRNPICTDYRLVQFTGTCWLNSVLNSLFMNKEVRNIYLDKLKEFKDKWLITIPLEKFKEYIPEQKDIGKFNRMYGVKDPFFKDNIMFVTFQLFMSIVDAIQYPGKIKVMYFDFVYVLAFYIKYLSEHLIKKNIVKKESFEEVVAKGEYSENAIEIILFLIDYFSKEEENRVIPKFYNLSSRNYYVSPYLDYSIDFSSGNNIGFSKIIFSNNYNNYLPKSIIREKPIDYNFKTINIVNILNNYDRLTLILPFIIETKDPNINYHLASAILYYSTNQKSQTAENNHCTFLGYHAVCCYICDEKPFVFDSDSNHISNDEWYNGNLEEFFKFMKVFYKKKYGYEIFFSKISFHNVIY